MRERGSIFSVHRMRAVMAKEFIQLLRDRTTFSMIVMIPIMQLLLFGYAINTDPKHLPAALLIQDNSVFARSFTRGLENSEYFKIARVASEKEADLLMQQGRVQFIINIPENFGRDIVRGVRPAVLIEADASDPVAAAGALAAASGVLPIVLAHDLTGPLATLKGKPEAVELRLQRRYNPEGFTRYNIIPGLVGVILTMTGVMMTALAITRERERGTMETLLSMPIHPSEVMAGKILPYIIIGYLQAFIIIITAGTLFGVPIHGSLGLLCLALLIFISCNLAIGFTLSAGAQNQMQATQLSMMVTLPSFMLSGFIFPFYGMPQWAQILGNIIPATHFIRITRGILLKGSGFSGVWPDIWPMLIFLVAATVFAMKRYRRTLD